MLKFNKIEVFWVIFGLPSWYAYYSFGGLPAVGFIVLAAADTFADACVTAGAGTLLLLTSLMLDASLLLPTSLLLDESLLLPTSLLLDASLLLPTSVGRVPVVADVPAVGRVPSAVAG